MWVPHKELKKKNQNQTIKISKGDAADGLKFFFFIIQVFFFFYFVLRFTSFGPSEFVGINTESALRDEGYV